MPQLPLLDMYNMRRDFADKMHVVADKHQRALELRQSLDHRVDAAHVEMRRRLVEQEKVGRVEQQLGQRESALFAPAQHADFLENIVLRE